MRAITAEILFKMIKTNCEESFAETDKHIDAENPAFLNCYEFFKLVDLLRKNYDEAKLIEMVSVLLRIDAIEVENKHTAWQAVDVYYAEGIPFIKAISSVLNARAGCEDETISIV